jgi:hypothetical protein
MLRSCCATGLASGWSSCRTILSDLIGLLFALGVPHPIRADAATIIASR